MVHALPRQIGFFVESSFGVGTDDMSANGTYVYVTNVDTSGLVEQTASNENNITHPREKHDNIRTLRNSSFSFGLYFHAQPSAAAEAAAATTYHIAELALAALGGQDLGYAAAVVSSEGEETNEIEIDADPGYVVGDWIYAYDTSAGVGEFYRILAIDAGPPITLTLDRDLHFTPDPGGADTARAVIDCYIHGYASTQPGHASHKTLQVLVQGDDDEDITIARGCKPTLSIEPITPGEPMQLTFEVAATTFDGADEAQKEDFGSATPVGEAPLVPGQADSSTFKLADFGSPLASVEHNGAITVVPGVTYAPIPGFKLEGVNGYIDAALEDTTLEVMVEFDADYHADYRARTYKHALIQIGNNSTNAAAIYFPKLEYAAEPPRNEESSVTGVTLSFRAHLNTASPGALAGDNLEKWKSGMHLLLLA